MAALIQPEGACNRVVLLALFFMQADPPQSLQLRIEAPPELASVRKRLESIDPQRFTDIAQLVGLTDEGPAIRAVFGDQSSRAIDSASFSPDGASYSGDQR